MSVKTLAVGVVTAGIVGGIAGPAVAAPPTPGPDRRGFATVDLGDRAFLNRDGSVVVPVAYRYNDRDRGWWNRSQVEVTLAQRTYRGHVEGTGATRRLEGDGRVHRAVVRVYPDRRGRFQVGRAFAAADLERGNRVLDSDRGPVFVQRRGW